MTSPKLAIAIDLNELRDLMREFIDERIKLEDASAYEWRLEQFLQWLRRKRQETSDVNATNRP